jgi:hypothetical protein
MTRTRSFTFYPKRRWLALATALMAGLLACGGLWAAFTLPGQAQPADLADLYPPGASLIPLGDDQSELRHAYQAAFEAIYDGQPLAWSAMPTVYDGIDYDPGTLIALHGLGGDFDSQPTDGTFTVSRAHVLHPVRIALFYSQVRDAADQVVTWEEATFETIFRVYLWGWGEFETISETEIIAGALGDYDVLILPSITIGYVDEVDEALGPQGRAAIAEWVAAGGTLYAQGDAVYLAETAGLAPAGTVNLTERLADLPPYDNYAELAITDPLDALTFSWLAPQTYILDDPVLQASPGITVVAAYETTTYPGTPAILFGRVEDGEMILTNAHPSVQQSTYPLVFDALFLAMGERCGLTGYLKQEFSVLVPDDVIPAYEPDIPVRVTTQVRDYWDADLLDVTITETVEPGFRVAISDVTPTPAAFTVGPAGTTIVWSTAAISPGVTSLTYVARTLTDTVASGEALVSVAEAVYTDPFTGRVRRTDRNPLYVHSQMAGRLNGDRDIELDGIYPLLADGAYFDIALTLENKEETAVQDIVITDVVALLSPIVDVDDQRLIPTVLTDTGTMTGSNETIWVANEVFFYNNANYPLPEGVSSNLEVINLSNWDGVTFYTYTNELSNVITIPPGYESYIQVTPEGAIRLPAAVLKYQFGALQAYDYLDPAVRYGIYSRELLGRQVSFASDPLLDAGVVMHGSGGSVFTNLGGHPIPYHEYLSSGIITIPQSPYPVVVAYHDIWNRPKALELRTVFYDIVPFPPPEYHAVVNTTFEMNADWDGDGLFTDAVLEYPARVPAQLHLMLKTHSNFDLTMPPLRKDETLISQGMFKGVGFTLGPAYGVWEDSWSFRDLQGKGPDATVLTDVVDAAAYTYLYFQQELDSQAYEIIDITGTLDASAQHTEGVMKVNDGARFVYHQKAVGPSRYEVFDSHVQAVFGLRSDALVSKLVAPVRIATYLDEVYHFVEIEDPWEPRQFTADPFIQSYGFEDMAATVYVGGRHQRELLWSRLNPGESTQIRVEINNNTGDAITGVSVVPAAPPGITVTLRTYTETTQIEPLFFDFPFLNAIDIWDAWKGVYYFDVDVADPFPGELGQVYSVTFALEGSGVPAGFRIPAAQIGIKDAAGNVATVYGQATNLTLQDRLPSWATLRDARIANAAEMAALVDAVNYDDAHPGSNTAGALYATLRTGIVTDVITSTAGSDVSLTLPPYAQLMPWDDSGELAQSLYVILRSDLEIDWSGTAVADFEPEITFVDHFGQVLTDTGNLETVESHGAALHIEYTVRDVQLTGGDWQLGDPLPVGARSEVEVEGALVNSGDDIAADTLVTYTLPLGAFPLRADPPWYRVNDHSVTWALGDIGPGVERLLRLTLIVTPSVDLYGQAAPLIDQSDAHFLNIYAQKYVTALIGGGLSMAAGGELEVYFNDFELAAGEEWSNPLLGRTPTGRGFLGEFNNGLVSLSLANLPAHAETRVAFDLYLIRTWDGNQIEYTWPEWLGIATWPAEIVGPDIWSLQTGGQTLLQTTFANWDEIGFTQAYPGAYPGGSYPARAGAVENNTLGYQAEQHLMDSVYHLAFTFPHSGPGLALDFAAAGLQSIEDESWGLDNVRVTIVSEQGFAGLDWFDLYLPLLAK